MLRSMVTPGGSGRRLSADDWLQAGFALLAEGGLNALRLDRLCQRLEVTKGSFYWHFADMRAYRAAIVEAWGDLRDADRYQLEGRREVDPRGRLLMMMSSLVDPSHWALERVMRVWALTDDEVGASVRARDGRLYRAVRQAFIDYGFEPDDADMRSAAMFAVGMGLLHVAGSAPEVSAQMRGRFLEFMLRP